MPLHREETRSAQTEVIRVFESKRFGRDLVGYLREKRDMGLIREFNYGAMLGAVQYGTNKRWGSVRISFKIATEMFIRILNRSRVVRDSREYLKQEWVAFTVTSGPDIGGLYLRGLEALDDLSALPCTVDSSKVDVFWDFTVGVVCWVIQP